MHNLDEELVAIGKVVKRYLGDGVHFVLVAKEGDYQTLVSTIDNEETIGTILESYRALTGGQSNGEG